MNPSKIAIISVITIAVIVGGYFIWKKLDEKKKRDQAIAQSKAAVTGVMNVLSANIREGFDLPPSDGEYVPPSEGEYVPPSEGEYVPPSDASMPSYDTTTSYDNTMPSYDNTMPSYDNTMPSYDTTTSYDNTMPSGPMPSSGGPGFSNSPIGSMIGNITPETLIKMDIYNNLVNAVNPAINFFTPNAPNCIPPTDARALVANFAIKAANALRAPFVNPAKFNMNDEVVMNYYATIPIALGVFGMVSSGMATGIKVVKSGEHASGLLVSNKMILSLLLNPVEYIMRSPTMQSETNPNVRPTAYVAFAEYERLIASFIGIPYSDFNGLVRKMSITPTEYNMLNSKFMNALNANTTATIPVSLLVSMASVGVYSAISKIPNVNAMDLCAMLLAIIGSQ